MANSGPRSEHRPPPPETLLGDIERLSGATMRRAAPVHLWNPPFCGDIDMRIAADGVWHYNGSPIGRAPLVRLFASILRRDEDRFVLVTPVEKLGVRVDDAPFLAVELLAKDADGQASLTFRTNVDDLVTVDKDHPLRFERGPSGGLKPYVLVRGGLWALVARAVFYDLVDSGHTEPWRGEDWFGVSSRGAFFPVTRAAELDGL